MTTNQKIGAAVGAVIVAAGLTAAVLLGTGPTNVPAGADLQAAINAASNGDTLQLANSIYTCNCTINKGLTIIGPAVVSSPNADPAIAIIPSTPPVTLRNLEVTGTWYQVFAIVRYGDQGPAQDTLDEQPQGLTMENVWVHGFATQEVQNCITANGRNFKFLNSKATDCHGKGYESHGIISWNGSGPFTVLDSYIEGAGINMMIGGAPPTIPNLVPDGLEVRRNHFFKPMSWRGVWTVKNLFELKNMRHAVIDGNVFENNWTDAQAGWAIQFTPRPSDSGPAAVVEDVAFTNNVIRNSGQGVNVLGADQAPAPTDTRLRRLRIANNVFDNINGAQFASSGNLFTVTNGTDTVTIENNSATHTGNIISSDYRPSTNFIYRNNITRHNDYGIFGSGQGIGNSSINFYFPGSIITGNQFAKEVNPPGNVESIYPAGNSFPATLATVLNLTTFRSLVAGVGADVDAIAAAQGGGGPATPTATATPSSTQTPQPQPSPTTTPTATPTPAPSPQPTCAPTSWPNSVNGQNSQMQTRRAQGCYPFNRSGNSMEYTRP